MPANELTANLPRAARIAAEDFQRYVVAEYQRRSRHWPLSKKLVQAVAQRLVETLGCNETIDLEMIAHLLKVELSFSHRPPSPTCGLLTAGRQGFRAVVFGHPQEPRTRFTIAHEYGHVFFYFGSAARPERIVPLSLDRGREEGLCDAFAGALLVPEKSLVHLTGSAAELRHVLSLSKRLNVSPEAVLRRLLYDMELWGTCVFYSIRRTGTDFDLGILRGIDRRKQTDAAPTKERLRRTLREKLQVWSGREVSNVLEREYGVKTSDVEDRLSTLWVRV